MYSLKSLLKKEVTVSEVNKTAFFILEVFSFFSLIMDSGGSGKLRLIGFLILFMEFFVVLYQRKISLGMATCVMYLLFISVITSDILLSLINSTTIASAIKYNAAIYIFILFYILSKNGLLKIEHYLYAEICFSLLLILLFIGVIFNISPILIFKKYLEDNFSGLYGQKPFLSMIFKVTYFQGTLSIVPAAMIFLYRKNYFSYCICLFALIISLSRFGVLICIFFLILQFFRKNCFLFISVFISSVLIMFVIEPQFTSVFSNVLADEGMRIRLGHIKGLNELYDNSVITLFLGQGPGAEYYSFGFNRYTDSVEISQLDLLRRYGIDVFLLFNILYFFVIYKLFQKNKYDKTAIAMGLVAHYIVSFSNPVLFSLPMTAVFAIAVGESEDI